MNNELSHSAAAANQVSFDALKPEDFVDGSPHLKHRTLQEFYAKLAREVYAYAARDLPAVRVLDLGAGEGSATLPFLEFGAYVTAVDVSARNLQVLQTRCAGFQDRLEIRCGEINEILALNEPYDIVIAISALHHIPDYLAMIHSAVCRPASPTLFFSFQDPLRYDTVGIFNRAFSDMAYSSWRVFRPQVWEGVQRRVRRLRGRYNTGAAEDMGEYHVVRQGVDQNAVVAQLQSDGFDCQVVPYFSTQSTFFQGIGIAIGAKNTFAIIARKQRASANQ